MASPLPPRISFFLWLTCGGKTLITDNLGNRGMCRDHEECGYWLISSSTTRWLKNCGHWFFCLSGVSWVMTFCPDGVSITLERILWQGRLMGQFGKCILWPLGQLQYPPLKFGKMTRHSKLEEKKYFPRRHLIYQILLN